MKQIALLYEQADEIQAVPPSAIDSETKKPSLPSSLPRPDCSHALHAPVCTSAPPSLTLPCIQSSGSNYFRSFKICIVAQTIWNLLLGLNLCLSFFFFYNRRKEGVIYFDAPMPWECCPLLFCCNRWSAHLSVFTLRF